MKYVANSKNTEKQENTEVFDHGNWFFTYFDRPRNRK
jgi:hypothetical protein